MPELPEVEVVRQGLSPQILGQKIAAVLIREQRLRFPVTPELHHFILGQKILEISRRGKYLLFTLKKGTLIWHLGMSGSLRVLSKEKLPQKHDHVELRFGNGMILRFNDPRRFGCLLFTEEDPLRHRLLSHLGPEPLLQDFSANYLWQKSRKRKVALKVFIMDSKTVVGVGNIYAAEALFAAKLHPLMMAEKLSLEQCQLLVKVIKAILRRAIKQGGTTLKDFVNSDGKPGYFKQKLQVYGRGGQPCFSCQTELIEKKLAQRATVYCPTCQKNK